ncbi:MAG: (2Fe-2S)-binding protein [Pirellulales bacterium]|jgi:sarcosine oxidase subunit alpha
MAERHGSSPHGPVRITIDGVAVECAIGTSVAAAILNRGGLGSWHVRTSVTGSPRGPLCGMGICFECRATIDGRPHERTCQLPVHDGMEVRTDA